MAFIYTYSVNREGGVHIHKSTHWTWAGIAFKPQYGLETGTKIFPMSFISTEAKAAHFSLTTESGYLLQQIITWSFQEYSVYYAA